VAIRAHGIAGFNKNFECGPKINSNFWGTNAMDEAPTAWSGNQDVEVEDAGMHLPLCVII